MGRSSKRRYIGATTRCYRCFKKIPATQINRHLAHFVSEIGYSNVPVSHVQLMRPVLHYSNIRNLRQNTAVNFNDSNSISQLTSQSNFENIIHNSSAPLVQPVIIHSTESKKESIHDSCLTERFYLEYEKKIITVNRQTTNRRNIMIPKFRIVDVESIHERIYVVEETPGIHREIIMNRDNDEKNKKSNLVVHVKNGIHGERILSKDPN